MLNEQTLQTLNALKLFGMARSFADKIAHPCAADLSHPEFFGLIVQDEKTYRDNLRLKRLLLNAKLTQPACLEDIDYKHPRGLNKQTILELSSTDWITRHDTVLLTGPTGVGKSYLCLCVGQFCRTPGSHRALSTRSTVVRNAAPIQSRWLPSQNAHPFGQGPTAHPR
jgi:DNA replication protein DnaC